mgnify:CR=1 FL=1
MQTISTDILEQFSAVLKKRAVPVSCHSDYRKWLRYYLDFRSKYPLPDSRSEHVRMFIQKLQKKESDARTAKAHTLGTVPLSAMVSLVKDRMPLHSLMRLNQSIQASGYIIEEYLGKINPLLDFRQDGETSRTTLPPDYCWPNNNY